VSSLALVDATTYVHGYDMTTDLNQISMNLSVEDQENTTFGSGGFRSRVGGLKSVDADLSGFWQSGTTDAIDPQAFANLGVADRVVTMSPTGAVGSTAYFFQAGQFSYEMFGSIGEVTPFSVSMMGSNGVGLVRGQIAKAKAAVSTTGATGSAVVLGNVAAGQYLYAAVHVMGTPGTTMTILVESDDSAGFASAVTRIAFPAITTAGGFWGVRLAGALAETHYRFRISAITGTFTIAGAIGIGS
jgi:hypothetical protein